MQVQRTSAEKVCSLLDNTLNVEFSMSCALEVFNLKWSKIDFHRLDKYIMLMDMLYEKYFSLKRIINKPNKMKNLVLNFKKLAVGIKNTHSIDSIKEDNGFTTTTFNFNFSFFRNFAKNIGKYLHVISLDEKSLYSVLTFVKILNSKEVSLYEEFILERLSKLIKVSWKNKENKAEFKSIDEVPDSLNCSKESVVKTLKDIVEFE